jgi:ComF family protein
VPLTSISRLPVCHDCISQIKPFADERCRVCGELLPLRGPRLMSPESGLCAACDHVRPAFAAAFSFAPYEGIWRDLIHMLKYDRVRSAAALLARRVAPEVPADIVARSPLIVPVPLHRSKFRIRGYNQAEEIARELGKLCKLRMNSHLLVRRRRTVSQTGMTPLQRRENVRGAFQIRKRYRRDLVDRSIILVDDVYTTGATANECARLLRRAGAAQVWIVTAARVTKLLQPETELVTASTGTDAGD